MTRAHDRFSDPEVFDVIKIDYYIRQLKNTEGLNLLIRNTSRSLIVRSL